MRLQLLTHTDIVKVVRESPIGITSLSSRLLMKQKKDLNIVQDLIVNLIGKLKEIVSWKQIPHGIIGLLKRNQDCSLFCWITDSAMLRYCL